ncbi:hypothetical protein Tco_0276416 [Tanacetum coccineum]
MNIKMIAVVTAVTTARANDQRNTSNTNLSAFIEPGEASRLCLGSQASSNHCRPFLQLLDLLSHTLDQALGFTRIAKLAILDVTLVLLVSTPGVNDYTEVPFDDEQILRQHNIAQVTPPAYTPSLPFLTTMEPADTLLMGDEDISTTPARETDKFIKSSVDDLVPIPMESEMTSDSNLECDMPINTPLPTTYVRKEDFDINSPLGEQVIDFLMENKDVVGLPRHLVKQLFSHLMSDEPLGDDSKPRSYDVTFSNSLFEFNDDFTLCNDNLLFDEEFEDISSLDPPKSAPLNYEPLDHAEIGLDDSIPTEIDDGYYDSEGDILFLEHLLIEETFFDPTPAVLPKKSTLLVTPPPASKQFSLREVERFDPFFSLTQSGGKTRVMETPSFGFHHMPSPRPAAYSPTEVMYRFYHPHLTSGDGFDTEFKIAAFTQLDLVNQRKKFFAEERAKAKRNKPMTQSQLKTYMMTYLKNQGSWKLNQLRKLSFEEVKEEFDKLIKQIDSFAPISFEATKDSLKRFGEELQTKTPKRLKEDKDDEAKDDEPTKKLTKRRKQIARKGMHTSVDENISDDSDKVDEQEETNTGTETETPLNPVPVAMKTPSVATYKIIKQGEKGVYQIVREDGTDIVYINFGAMLKSISRDDLTELYRIVMNRYGLDGPEDKLEKGFWKCLRVMFEEPLSTDSIWSEIEQQKILSWRYYDTSRVHCLNLESMDVYLLSDRKYPLPTEFTMSKQHKDWLVQEQTALGKDFSNPFYG